MTTFVLIIFLASGQIQFERGFTSFERCQTAQNIVMVAGGIVQTPEKRPLAAYCTEE